MSIKINNLALDRSKIIFSKEPLEKSVEKIIKKNGVDGTLLAGYLDNILNNNKDKKSFIDETEKIKDENIRNALKDVVNLAEDYKDILPISLGEILAKISKLIKEFTDSIINFSKLWNDSMDSNLKISISAAQNNLISEQIKGFGEIASGVVAAGAGAAMIGVGAYESSLLQKENGELGKIVSGIPKTEESLNVASSEVAKTEENVAEELANDKIEIELKEVNPQGEQTTVEQVDAEKAIVKNKKDKNKIVCETEEDKRLEREKIKKKYEAQKAPVDRLSKALFGIQQASSAIPGGFNIIAAKKGAEASVDRAYADYVSTRKAQNQQLFDNSSRQTTSIADLSQSINAYIRACIPA